MKVIANAYTLTNKEISRIVQQTLNQTKIMIKALKINVSIAGTSINMVPQSSGSSAQPGNTPEDAQQSEKFKSIGNAGKSITDLGKKGASFLKTMVVTSAAFNSNMSQLYALTNANANQMQLLKDSALQFGSTTQFSASEVSKGMNVLAASGMGVNDMLSAMPGIINAASASGGQLDQVAASMANTMRAFGLNASEATHVADVLAKSANMSGYGMKNVADMVQTLGPLVQSLGFTLEDTSAAIVAMGKAGISAKQAGSTLQTAFQKLIHPSQEARAVLKDLGIQLLDQQGKMKPFHDIIGQLTNSMSNMTSAQKNQVLATLFGAESVNAMTALLHAGKQNLDQYTQSLVNSDGTAKQMADTMNDNLMGSLNSLKNAAQIAAISLGDALSPYIRQAVDLLKNLMDHFNSLSPSMKQTIALSLAIATGIALIGGPLLMLIGFLPNLVQGINMVGTAMRILFSAMRVLTLSFNPIGLAILALVAVGYILWQNWSTIVGMLQNLWSGFAGFITGIWNGIWKGISGFINMIIGGINSLIGAINNISIEIPDWVPVIGGKKFGINIPKIPTIPAGGSSSAPQNASSGAAGAVTAHSHAYGLSYVPYDGYLAKLHKGERVLTRAEADQYRKGAGRNVNIVIQKVADRIDAGSYNDVDRLLGLLEERLVRVAANMGAV